ncbi:MAG TPA: SPOR domain-containing protein [Bacteroidia bacterium]|nr:SPOR domain-containing protein [Bacteroidia bacterium]HNT79319.1 SPOR domain-containing protein [Bacteroidia bacterium]
MLRLHLILLIFLISANQSSAQEKALLKTNFEEGIELLASKWKEQNILRNSMPGYRVQLSFGNDRIKANQLRSEFLLAFPEIPAYMLYQQPYYKVRVGDCKDRLSALRVQELIKKLYPSNYIVSDDIPLPF